MRGCGAPLERRGRTWHCQHGHQFDSARSGYINLLQPQDKKATTPGDNRAAVESRTRLLAAGVGRATLDDVVGIATGLTLPHQPPVVVELGSGSGALLGALMQRRPVEAVGIDLSSAAASVAARQFPDATWVVANADRRLPLLDASVDLIVSVHARRNPAECRRVLDPRGRLIVAVPAADDLIELRRAVQGDATRRNRMESVVAEHQPYFDAVEHRSSCARLALTRDMLVNLLAATYRGQRFSHSSALDTLDRLDVTLASDVVVFSPRAD